MSSELSNRAVLKMFWEYAGPSKKTFVFCGILMFVILALQWAMPLVVETATRSMETGDQTQLDEITFFFFFILFGDYLARSGYSYLMSLGVLNTITTIRDKLFQHVLRMKIAFFDKQPVGVLLTRTISDCETLAESLRSGAATIIVDILAVFVYLAAMIKLDLHLSYVIMVMIPITWFLVRWCGMRLREKYLEVRRSLATANGFMAEGIMGATILQLFRAEQASADEFAECNKVYRHATITNNVYDALLSALIDGIGALTTAITLMVAFNIRFGMLELATAVAYTAFVERIFVPIRDFSSKFATIQQALAAMQRVFSLLVQAEHLPQGPKMLRSNALDIEFENLSFRYLEDGPNVLKNVSFNIGPGQVFALVGQTGSGKSTIGKLLIRAYDGYEGKIKVGGEELADLNYNSLRSHIAVIHQDIELFPATIRDNISMFDSNIKEDKINWAIDLIKARHMINALPGGLHYQVKEAGSNLSAGQLQLIVFARALVYDAPIVIMDEATSSVDSVTESWIQQAIEQIFKHKTVLIVAHRLSTIAAADKILVLKYGEIIESGTHNELLEIQDGYYAGLIKASELSGHGKSNLMV